MKPIILIGMMGSGKTTIGHLLAHESHMTYLDTDECVEQISQQQISTLFKIKGEPYFRQLEHDALLFAKRHAQIISTGGGILTNSDNYPLLLDAHVFYLQASLETLLTRITTDNRPLLQQDVAKTLATLLHNRHAIYEQFATHIIQTDSLTPEEVTHQIWHVVHAHNNVLI